MNKYNVTRSHANKFVWFRVAKTGTRSVLESLERRALIVPEPGYDTTYHQTWDNWFKFTFVRNPWTRLVSCYLDKVVKCTGTQWELPAFARFKNMCFKQFVNTIKHDDLTSCDCHYRLQTCLYPLDKIDHVGRFEELQHHYNIICEKLSIQTTQLPVINTTLGQRTSIDAGSLYDADTAQLVSNMYEKDIQQLKYGWNCDILA